jgi:transketolase
MRRAALDMVHALAQRDPRILYVGSDPSAGEADKMRADFPERFLIEGISEANVIGMAAGLAMEGYVPYVNTIATFLTRRCYDQVAVDLCLHELPVRLIANGGGLVYAPLGPTHQAIEDIAIMRALPNMAVVVVADAEEMKRFMEQSADWPGPIYIRLARGGDPVISQPELGFKIGEAILMRPAGDVLFVSTGPLSGTALAAAEQLQEDRINCGVLHVHTVKPFDADALLAAGSKARLIVTLEEHTRIGGLGSAVLETLGDAGDLIPRVVRLGIPDRFSHNYGSQSGLLKHYGLDTEAVVATVRAAIDRPPAHFT